MRELLPLGFGGLLGGVEVRARVEPLRDRVDARPVGEHPPEVGEHPLEHLHLALVQREHDETVAAGDRRPFAHRVVLHRGPEPVRVQPRATSFSHRSRVPLATTALPSLCTCNMRRCAFALRVAEQLLEHVRDVVHQVDRIVPDDHDPRDVGPDVGVAEQLLDGVGDDDLLGADLGGHASRG